MTNTISKEPPYADTEISWQHTRIDIEGILQKYGAVGIRWTRMQNLDDLLEFMVMVDVQGMKKEITVAVSPPHIFRKRRPGGRGPIITTEDKNQEYRLLFHWIKSKLEAVAWGLSSMEHEFLSEISLNLPDGSHITVGQVIVNLIGKNNMRSLPFYGEQNQSIPQPQPRRNVTNE